MRIDSGDLPVLARQVRDQLDGLGAEKTRIVATGDLDEHAIARLAAAPVDVYGVGTAAVTGSAAPTANLVYKLVARTETSGPSGRLVGIEKYSAARRPAPSCRPPRCGCRGVNPPSTPTTRTLRRDAHVDRRPVTPTTHPGWSAVFPGTRGAGFTRAPPLSRAHPTHRQENHRASDN